MIGRQQELKEMHKLLATPNGEMLAVLGRRRVGKTFLIRNAYANKICFELVGVENGNLKEQLGNFHAQLQNYFNNAAPKKQAKNWLEAFNQLSSLLQKNITNEKRVIFFDEVPWLGQTSKSKFIEALGYFWNSWASQKLIVLVLCGSATSWITNHIINSKGGLHNRITKKIHLQPFTLQETKQLLTIKVPQISNTIVLQLYMTFGGIPHYLNQIEHGKSAQELIQEICFAPSGNMYAEFDALYKALFSNANDHIEIVKILHSKLQGLTRQELLKALSKKDGGSLTRVLNELVQCDFVIIQNSFYNKKNRTTYRLLDEYSIFYLSFMDGKKNAPADYWLQRSQTTAYTIWSAYAFENVCFRHLQQIKKAMNLTAIIANFSSFYFKGSEELPGAQIDLLLDRADKVINLFEIKYYQDPIYLTKQDAIALQTKLAIFRQATKTKKQLFVSMISAHGIASNNNSAGLLAHNLNLDDLFEA
jgi:uncharacterized protein